MFGSFSFTLFCSIRRRREREEEREKKEKLLSINLTLCKGINIHTYKYSYFSHKVQLKMLRICCFQAAKKFFMQRKPEKSVQIERLLLQSMPIKGIFFVFKDLLSHLPNAFCKSANEGTNTFVANEKVCND